MAELKQLVIDRKIWLRGEGSLKSKLIRESDGKQCCVGIYLLSCGVEAKSIINRGAPKDCILPTEAQWVNRFSHSQLTHKLYDVNDNKAMSEETRERKIAATFLECGVEVTFVDGLSA